MNYNRFLLKKEQYYYDYSLKLSEKSKKYLSHIFVVDKYDDNNRFPVKYDFFNEYRNNYFWYLFVSDYLQKQSQRDKKIAIFLTATLPSEYHPYKTIMNKKHIKNKKYSDKTIREGYRKLQDFFRYLYSSFKVNRKSVKLKFVRVIEPHKDFTPHLHAVIFIDKEYIEQFKKHFENSLELYSLGEQYKFEVINNIQASVSYLLKYIRKSFNSDDERTARIFDGWKRANKIRVFSSSQIPVTREIYKIVSRFLKLTPLELQDRGVFNHYNILEVFEQVVSYNVDYYDEKGKLYNRKQHTANDKKHARAFVEIKKQRLKNKDFKEYSRLLSAIDLYNNVKKLDYDLIFSELYKLSIDLKELHDYFCVDYCNYRIAYISDNYDYKQFFMYLNKQDFIDLLEDYIFTQCGFSKYRYKIIDIKVMLFYDDLSDYILVYDKQDYKVEYSFNTLSHNI